MDELRIFKRGGLQSPWTKQQILAGLQKFYQDEGRYPTAHEIDDYMYLPASRSIQRSFGGLVKLRQELIPDGHHDHTRGAYRSEQAQIADRRAQKYEETFNSMLCSHFFEVAVHEHKVVRPGNTACDFFIYLSESTGVVIDLFYAKSIRTLLGVVNIKAKKYEPVPYEVYFLLIGNPDISQSDITSRVNNRTNPLPGHIRVITEDYFQDELVAKLKARSEFAR